MELLNVVSCAYPQNLETVLNLFMHGRFLGKRNVFKRELRVSCNAGVPLLFTDGYVSSNTSTVCLDIAAIAPIAHSIHRSLPNDNASKRFVHCIVNTSCILIMSDCSKVRSEAYCCPSVSASSPSISLLVSSETVVISSCCRRRHRRRCLPDKAPR